jgi:hypothetical protein
VITETTKRRPDGWSTLGPYQFGVAQIALSHGLALQRAANGALKSTLPARALATFVRGALSQA